MKNKIAIPLLTLILSLFTVGCAEMMQLANQLDSSNKPLTTEEVSAGLKEALIQGAKKSAARLGQPDGYYKNEAVKILLPPEADIIVKNASKLPGGDKLIEDALRNINRAAEDAAREAAPIFINSIRQLTLSDAMNILKGEPDAATQYLRNSTYEQLVQLYRPKIKASVEKKIAGNVSTKESWETLTSNWNKVAGSFIGQSAGLKTVNTELEDYLTRKALDGLFLKIAEEEQTIRKDPAARATELLKRVFGSVNSQ